MIVIGTQYMKLQLKEVINYYFIFLHLTLPIYYTITI